MARLIYDVHERPKAGQLIIFALQQLFAIIAGTIAVPALIGLPEMMPAAILGCGLGTLIYLTITKRKSPVILSSNFAFIGALIAAKSYGYLGIILGGLFTGSVYVILSIVIRCIGTKWIDKFLPPIIIGPVVSLIGLTLAGSAMADLVKANGYFYSTSVGTTSFPYNLLALLCGLVTFIVVIICSVQNRRKFLTLIPFLIGIGAGYLLAATFSIFGYCFDVAYMKIIDFGPIKENFSNISITSFLDYPRFALLKGIDEISNNNVLLTGIGVLEIALAFIPVALVSFSEHIADHKNLGTIINKDLLGEEPGLSRTLLGDGLGSAVGTTFGICPITTYSQSVGCVAITKNASVATMFVTSFMCIGLCFFTPFIKVLQTIPSCVMGGICLALYGFIAVSGLKMLKGVNLGEAKNLYTLSAILIVGIGGLSIEIPYEFGIYEGTTLAGPMKTVSISSIAAALIIGIITYNICRKVEKKNLPADEDSGIM